MINKVHYKMIDDISVKDLSIASIVATGSIDREFDLEAVENDIDAYSINYSRHGAPGLYMKLSKSEPTIALYRSGSFNIRGASSVEEVYACKSSLVDKLTSLDIEIMVSSFSITNMVFTADLEKQMDLGKLSVRLGLENIEYEPEQFPGLVYRTNQGVIIIFSSGKLVLTGFTNIAEAKETYKKLSGDLANA